MVASLTIARYKRRFIPFAILAMAIHRLPLLLNRKCSFWKLLGSSRNGSFDLTPDWQQWGLLAVWEDRKAFDDFQRDSFISGWFRIFCKEQWTVLLQPIEGHGSWDKREPFVYSKSPAQYTGPIAVLTRATISTARVRDFWKNVPQVAELIKRAPGFIMSVGIGEMPFFKQATFSIWESEDEMRAFAYGANEHRTVIKKTRTESWYSEELFARFYPLASFGTIRGQDPLKSKIKNV